MKKVILAFIITFLMGCSPSVEGQIEPQAKHPLLEGHQQVRKPNIKEIKTSKPSLVLVLCSADKLTEAKNILEKHQFLTVKQSSPTVITVSWHGNGSFKMAKEILLKETNIFCHVQENYKYNTMQ